MNRSSILVSLIAASLIGLTACSPAAGSSTNVESSTAPSISVENGNKPTIVLLHGAFEDASTWAPIVAALQKENFDVVAPAVPLRGVASDVANIRSFLSTITGDLVLVGHSYAGMLVSELASQLPNVTSAVYVAAFIPEKGESAGELNAKYGGTLLGPETLVATETPEGTALTVSSDAFAQIAGEDLPREAIAVAAASQRPILASAFGEAATSTAPKELPAYAIVAERDNAIPTETERWMASRAGAKITAVDAPHAVHLAAVSEVLDVIRTAASN